MKKALLLSLMIILSTQNVKAEAIVYNTQRSCKNTFEASIKNRFLQGIESKECAAYEAKLFATIKCEDSYGNVKEQRVHNLQCVTKIFNKFGIKYNSTECSAKALTHCQL